MLTGSLGAIWGAEPQGSSLTLVGSLKREFPSSATTSLWKIGGFEGPPSKLSLFSMTVIWFSNLDYIFQRVEEEFIIVVKSKASGAGLP